MNADAASGHAAHTYHVVVLDEHLQPRHASLTDPVPTARQILKALNLHPVDEFSLYAVLKSGEFEDLRLDEPYDLRGRGAERFVVFRTDRDFKFRLNDRQLIWGAPRILGRVLKTLAGVDPATHDVYLDVPGAGGDALIGDDATADLAAPGVERLYTRPRALDFRIEVNSRSREVHKARLGYQEVVELAFPGVPPDPNSVYSIDYSNGPKANPEGALVSGRDVEIQNGMVFYVSRTTRS